MFACMTPFIQRTVGVQDCISQVCGAGGTELSRARCGCIASLALEAALRNFSKTRPGH